jgi:hypothetical protein
VTESQKKYLEEYEKWKHIVVTPGTYKQRVANENYLILYEVVDVDDGKEEVTIKNTSNGFLKKKTLHWARKNLEPYAKVT